MCMDAFNFNCTRWFFCVPDWTLPVLPNIYISTFYFTYGYNNMIMVLAIPLLYTTGFKFQFQFMYLYICVCTYDTYTFIHKTTFIIHRNYDDNAVVVEAVVVKNVVYGNRGGQSTYRVVSSLRIFSQIDTFSIYWNIYITHIVYNA